MPGILSDSNRLSCYCCPALYSHEPRSTQSSWEWLSVGSGYRERSLETLVAGTSLSESSSFEMARACSSEFAGKDLPGFFVAGAEDFTDVTLPSQYGAIKGSESCDKKYRTSAFLGLEPDGKLLDLTYSYTHVHCELDQMNSVKSSLIDQTL